ncbi:MAG: tetratricopeptide repeat protein [Chloroflexota bacterium]
MTNGYRVDVALNPFEKRLKQALKVYNKPERLGKESPLASAYVLSHALRDVPRPVSDSLRGEILRREIRLAATELWGAELPESKEAMQELLYTVRQEPDSQPYAYIVLELRCFNDYFQPRRTSDIWEQAHLLPGSKSQHYRDFDVAVKQLGRVLLQRLRPALRLEHPIPVEHLIGYEAQMDRVIVALQQGQSVAITGAGGIGKTSLGSLIVHTLQDVSVFWYTLRPTFNDNMNSLLFALGYFLHDQGASNLWQYLVAADGAISDLHVASGLLRQDLMLFQDRFIILCFDELEYLYTSDPAFITPAHAQMLDLIEGLRGSVPLLLLSQRPVVEVDHHIELVGLEQDSIQHLWYLHDCPLDATDAQQVYTYTGGNPRLLMLCLALHLNEGCLSQAISVASTTSGLLPILNRLWRRLNSDERRLLQRLSVFRSMAPEDVWDVVALRALVALRLVSRDSHGGVSLLPALREIVLDELPTELRAELHCEAAMVRLERAEYTATAYHLWKGDQENKAVQMWFPQRKHEILRGEIDTALAVFEGISRHRLGKQERKALDIIRAELHQLVGQFRQGLMNLERIDWQEQSEAAIRIQLLRGEFQEALGLPEAALNSYTEGSRLVARLLGQITRFHQRRGLLYLRQRELSQSWQEIHHAEYEIHLLRGFVQEEEGRYSEALVSYQNALVLAQLLDDDANSALVERQLAALFGRQQNLALAVQHAHQALAIYERIGDRVNLEKVRCNLAFIYVQTGQFVSAIETGVPAYEFFRHIHDPYFAASTGANIAEAYFELGDLDNAQRYAFEVLDLDARHTYPYAYFTLGQVKRSQQSWNEAEMHFSESMHRAEQNEDLYLVAYARQALGDVYAKIGSHEAAHLHLTEALLLFRQFRLEKELKKTEELLSELKLESISYTRS